MGKFWSGALLTLAFSLLLATAAVAGPVYLKDGAVIEAQKVWRVEGKVHVLVNRDVLLTFAPEEVNIKKTFGKQKTRLKRKADAGAVKPAAARERGGEQGGDNPAPAAADKPATPSTPVQPGAAAPAGGGTTASVAKPAPQAPADKPAVPAPAAKPAPPQQAEPAKQAEPATPAVPPMPPVKQVDAGMGMMAAMPSLIISLILILVVIVSFWKVFEKAGQAGWKSLIPIYNLIVLIQIAGKPLWWFLLCLVPLVNIIFLVLLHIELAKRFGKGAVFGLGLCFLGFIFFPILAFDNSTYS